VIQERRPRCSMWHHRERRVSRDEPINFSSTRVEFSYLSLRGQASHKPSAAEGVALLRIILSPFTREFRVRPSIYVVYPNFSDRTSLGTITTFSRSLSLVPGKWKYFSAHLFSINLLTVLPHVPQPMRSKRRGASLRAYEE
jgi:hypothetical protein